MTTITVQNKPRHPMEELVDSLSSLIEDVKQTSYSFDDELAEIEGISLTMSPDPENGVTELNNLYADVQGYLSRVSSIVIAVYKEKATWMKYKHRADRLYRKARARLYTTQPSIRTAKNKEIQEAMIQEEVPELVDIREIVFQVLEDIEMVLDIMKNKQELLDKFNTNLSRQQKIVDTLIGLNYPVHHSRESES